MKNLNYRLRELTPPQYMCGTGPLCPAVYELVREYCGASLSCPAIYELFKSEECGVGAACLTVYGTEDNNYIIIGKKLDPKDFGLEEKVGKDETLISIPKGLIEKLKK